jgi:hypothetical protein
MIELVQETAPKAKGYKTLPVSEGEDPTIHWTKGSALKRPCRIPTATTVHGYPVHVVINGTPYQPGAVIPLTFDEFDSIVVAVRARQRADFISKFGDPDVPRRGINLTVATLSGAGR